MSKQLVPLLKDVTDAHGGLDRWRRLTRDFAPGWSGAVGRIDLPTVRAQLERLGGVADSFVCGSTGFVEAASALLLEAGQPAESIRTERFGPSGE